MEDQLDCVFETDDKEECMKIWRLMHIENPDRYHEVYEYDEEYGWIGICQFKPGDPVAW